MIICTVKPLKTGVTIIACFVYQDGKSSDANPVFVLRESTYAEYRAEAEFNGIATQNWGSPDGLWFYEVTTD